MPESRFKLNPEDYTDPACPFCTEQYEKEPPVRRIPEDRILARLDGFLDRGDTASAERLLAYWLDEALAGRDLKGEFLIRNERVGLFRNLGRRDDALEEAEKTLALADRMGIGSSAGAAAAYVNAATAMKAFGLAADGLPLFEKARAILESARQAGEPLAIEQKRADKFRLGSLYNNYALALSDCGRFSEAAELFRLALAVMETLDGSEPERAVTWLNLADLLAAEKRHKNGSDLPEFTEDEERTVSEYLETARDLLDGVPDADRGGNYAFVCEKCAPVFDWYGWFLCAKDLRRRAEEIRKGE